MRWPASLTAVLLAGLTGLPADAQGVLSISGTVRVPDGGRTPAVVYVPAPPGLATNADTAVVDQRQLTYVPIVSVVAPGTVVRFRNSDPVVHNVFSPTKVTGQFDLGRYGPDEARTHTFTQPGAALILCRMHPEMFAHILVVNATVWAVTDGQGRFRVDSLPPDATELVVWHPRGGTRRVPLSPSQRGPLVITLSPP